MGRTGNLRKTLRLLFTQKIHEFLTIFLDSYSLHRVRGYPSEELFGDHCFVDAHLSQGLG